MQIQQDDQEKQSLIEPQNVKVQENKTEQKQQKVEDTPKEQLPQQIVHKVQYGDTLEGLSLQYSVPIGRIRYRNHIDGDAIYHLKQIIIPNPQVIPQSKQMTQDLLVQQFVAHMDYSQKEKKIARYYLVEANWQLQEALKQYRQDLQWQRQNKPRIQTLPITGTEIQMKEIKRFYDRLELYKKKTN